MKITAKKGELYESIEMEIRAILNSKMGDKLLNNENAFKKDTEIIFVQKRDKK